MAAPNQSTQQLVDIAEIRDNIVILKDGSLRAVVEVSAINFELRSEDEQVAILQNFQRFLNSVDFSLQLSTISRRLFIDTYLKYVEETTRTVTNELLRIQSQEYIKFVKELSALANIMSKKFYIVVPFYAFENPAKAGIGAGLKSILKPSTGAKKLSEEQFNIYRDQILQRAELVYGNLVGLGLRTKLLGQEELINLFYNLYNPTTDQTAQKGPQGNV
ncbi:MAG: hypothetical protein A3B99_01145 [Candidatus Yanofskybacteria bacterium RIFCSPHIGHO2_02_FULL_44_12b]|uniref:TraC-like domain-containing protein n=2 Tax=Candidatus Yanofskyibacteriota TaxID=1752733 RepID=A0A1F8GJ47_9BACT|nr:MAG: hypothetical protein UW79_C0009G0024 [Candidatus Yanofskybacteria bacterium GW2011_GWA2_44_9]OGN05432.1 MAG: hypothetical protein A2659_03810 [Candidatus Yanofskybacteria bacterium RIFCSPHIGHO2_01_FULL_44_24]OGN15438.1 MAG: hypothetical protein A3B99_01145 [Candidatus Yanofskybacteria bacterium RIFCSPHIGHO2_02_FULL_44_12b]OGN25422.1 MAG: hypothetical protein A2925_00110 [Candidatus Yanofskybacteria bacterium RIFCSPLOWO2_01_FULL_44_22]